MVRKLKFHEEKLLKKGKSLFPPAHSRCPQH